MTVEGFTNYATAGVPLTLDNDRAMSEGLRALVWLAIDAAPEHDSVPEIWTVEEAERFVLADALKDYVERLMERGTRDGDVGLVASQMARAGFEEVDWDELARHYVGLAKNEWERGEE